MRAHAQSLYNIGPMTGVWLDKKYTYLIAGSLRRFKWVSSNVANFRCPFCGDSQSSQIKARGYLFLKQHTYLFKCHRCGLALPFGAFLKRLSRSLYDEYVMEKLTDTAPAVPPQTVPEILSLPMRLTHYEDVFQLTSATLPTHLHPVRAFAAQRGIPDIGLRRLYATSRARAWLAPLVGAEKAERVHDNEPYLVIPLRMPDRTWYGAQLRPIDHKNYYTFRWGHDTLRVFGLDAWNPNALTYIVEGPLDSLFLPNALACCGSDFLGALDTMTNAGYSVQTRVLVWDNEPRNKEITKKLRRAITNGERVVIWRNHHAKDINDSAKAGFDVASLVATHTYQGLNAELEYATWVKS